MKGSIFAVLWVFFCLTACDVAGILGKVGITGDGSTIVGGHVISGELTLKAADFQLDLGENYQIQLEKPGEEKFTVAKVNGDYYMKESYQENIQTEEFWVSDGKGGFAVYIRSTEGTGWESSGEKKSDQEEDTGTALGYVRSNLEIMQTLIHGGAKFAKGAGGTVCGCNCDKYTYAADYYIDRETKACLKMELLGELQQHCTVFRIGSAAWGENGLPSRPNI